MAGDSFGLQFGVLLKSDTCLLNLGKMCQTGHIADNNPFPKHRLNLDCLVAVSGGQKNLGLFGRERLGGFVVFGSHVSSTFHRDVPYPQALSLS